MKSALVIAALSAAFPEYFAIDKKLVDRDIFQFICK